MGFVSRGARNAFRSPGRSFFIVLILGLCIGLSISMLVAMQTIDHKISTIKKSIGSTITVSPAGVRGPEGGGELLTSSDIVSIKSTPHVATVTSVITDRLTSSDTNLVSSIEPGSFGQRQQRVNGGNIENNRNSLNRNTNFVMPISITGISDLSATQALNIDSLKYTSGSGFVNSTTENVAIVGSDLATKNSLIVGSTFKAYGTDVKVVGIFDSGNKFENSSAVFPLIVLQKLSGQNDQISTALVHIDCLDYVDSATQSIKTKLGDKADVVSANDAAKSTIEPLTSIKNVSLYGLFGSLISGAVIILSSMIIIARERRREIGTLKAIGAPNYKIVSQFVTESTVLAFFGSLVGIVFGYFFSNPILNYLATSSQNQTTGGGGFGGGRGMGRMAGMFLQNQATSLRNIQSVIDYKIVLYGIAFAVGIAIVGSAIPAWLTAKIRPAEVMRGE